MTALINPKMWMVTALLLTIFTVMLIIIKRNYNNTVRRQNTDVHSEVIDTL